jgi:hypothetical protein
MKVSTQQSVTSFLNVCEAHGFTWYVRGTVVTIMKRFAAGSKEEYTYADMFAGDILSIVPGKGGSVWGTDGGSIGGAIGLRNGEYVLNKSGVGKLFIKALSKI